MSHLLVADKDVVCEASPELPGQSVRVQSWREVPRGGGGEGGREGGRERERQVLRAQLRFLLGLVVKVDFQNQLLNETVASVNFNRFHCSHEIYRPNKYNSDE